MTTKKPKVEADEMPVATPKPLSPLQDVADSVYTDKIQKMEIVANKVVYGPLTDYQKPQEYIEEEEKANALTKEQAEAYLGADPKNYFLRGIVPKWIVKTFGDKLDDSWEEQIAFNEATVNYPGLILFKQKSKNVYTVLVPKVYSEYELAGGEYVTPAVRYDVRVIAFTRQGGPTSYEKTVFLKELKAITSKLREAKDLRNA